MRKLTLLLVIVVGITANAQTYVSGSFSYYDGAGSFNQQSMATIEMGRYIHEVATVGIAAGRTSFSSGKTYIEFRPSLVAWNNRQFTLAGTLGAGYVFDSPEKLLTEYCGTMSYNLRGDKWSISIFAGGYHFNGKQSSSKYTFVGTGISYTFKKFKP